MNQPAGPFLAQFARNAVAAHTLASAPPACLLVGVAGGVAVGKSHTAQQLAELFCALLPGLPVQVVCTDGFLLPKAQLEAGGLMDIKGFPQTYRLGALDEALERLALGQTVEMPSYSHASYDVDGATSVAGQGVVIVEGVVALHGGPEGPPLWRRYGHRLFLDAPDALLESWYLERFMALWRQGQTNPASYFYQYKGLTAQQAAQLGAGVWARVNRPNLENHIRPTRLFADAVLTKGEGHQVIQAHWAEPPA